MRYTVTGKAMTLVILATLALSPAALADRPRRQETRRVEALADELSRAAVDLTASVRRNRRIDTRAELKALRQLEAFEAGARRYERRVRRSNGDLRDTWGAFQSMSRAYDRAAVAFDRLHPVRRVGWKLSRIDSLMDRLSRLYDRPYDGRYGPPARGPVGIRGH